ncbi:MAG: anti-sigma factor [Chloroflexota bacterium]
MNERMDDLLAVYALGGLSDDETIEVEAYLAENPEADAEFAQMLQVVDALAYAPEPLQITSKMEDDLMARVLLDSAPIQQRTSQKSLVASKPVASNSPTFWDSLKHLFAQPAIGMTASAFALLLFAFLFVLQGRNQALVEEQQELAAQSADLQDSVGLLAEEKTSLEGDVASLNSEISSLQEENQLLSADNAILTERIATLSTENEDLVINNSDLAQAQMQLASEIADLMIKNNQLSTDVETIQSETELAQNVLGILQSPDVNTITVPGFPDTQPDASGQIVLDRESNTAVLLVSGLAPLPEGSVYQVLLIQGSEHETAETFLVDTQGESVLIVSSNSNLGAFDAVGVSIEPDGGSEQRTGDIVILGSIANQVNDS